MDLNSYYSYIMQTNGFDLSDKTNNPWGAIIGSAAPFLVGAAGKVGQEIQFKRSSAAVRPENIDNTINNITSGKRYNNFVQNAIDLAKFQNNPTYETAATFDKGYEAARIKIRDNLLNGTIDGSTYVDRIQQLNQNTIANRQTTLNKDYSSLTSKYQGTAGYNNLQAGIDSKLNLEIGARTHFNVPANVPTTKPAFLETPTMDYKSMFSGRKSPLQLEAPQLNLPELNLPGLNNSVGSLNVPGQSSLSTTLSTPNTTTPVTTTNTPTTPVTTPDPQTTTPPPPTSTQPSFLSNMKTAGAGAAGGMVASMGVSALGNVLGANNSKAGQMATGAASQIVGTVGSTVGSNLASGAGAFTNLGSSLTSVANIAQGGMGLANVALDVFDPVKKSKAENITNMGLGAVGLGAALLGAGPVGWAAGGALLLGNVIGHTFGQKTESFTANKDLLSQTGGSYGGSVDKIMTAQSLAGQKHSLWDNGGRHKDDNKIFEAKRQQGTLNQVIGYNNDRRDIAQSNSGIMHTGREFELAGGYQQGVQVGREGMVITGSSEILLTVPTEEFKDGGSIENNSSFIELVDIVEEFQQGGSINVIPDGALHARKHNMDIEGITTKGIPVVSEKEGGEVEQHAEIEKEEIIFRLEVTKKLEELAQDGSDEAAVEAGKLLVNEILYNTIDNTNNLL